MRVITDNELTDVLARTVAGVSRVVTSGNYATPAAALTAVDKALPEYRLFALNAQPGLPDRGGVTYETPFVGAGMRHTPNLRYYPCRLSLVPQLFAGPLPPDVVVLHTSTPRDGTVSLGTEVNILPAAIDAAHRRGGLVIAQLNPQMPYTFGDAVIGIEDIDYGIDADVALPEPAMRPPDTTALAIAQHVAQFVDDGATLQLGIGAVPDATLAALTGRRSLRIWSEMFSDGVLALERAGALDIDAVISASFVFGSAELYRWLHRNPRVRLARTETTNDPAVIATRPALVSINSALQVDLFGQANAHHVPAGVHSGFGGQPDFVVGALHSPGGKAIVALPSWHDKTDTSRVMPVLAGPVTSFQHSYLISEQGTARVFGADSATQARDIIEHVAHPRARDELRHSAQRLGLTRD